MKPSLIMSLLMLAVSCSSSDDNDAPLRREKISVFHNSSAVPVERLKIPLEGGEGTLRVRSDLPLEIEWQESVSSSDRGWFELTDIAQDGPGVWMLGYKAESILKKNGIARRGGCLSLNNAENLFGLFIVVDQGFDAVYKSGTVTDGAVVLAPGESFTTETLSKMATDVYDYVTFNAYALYTDEHEDRIFCLDMTVDGGAQVDAIARKTVSLNVPVAEEAASGNFHYILLSNRGETMPDNTAVTFSVPEDNPAGSKVVISGVAVYKVTEKELGLLTDEEEWEDDVMHEETDNEESL